MGGKGGAWAKSKTPYEVPLPVNKVVSKTNICYVLDQEELIKVKQVIIHEGYQASTYVDDIAILIMEKDVVLEKNVNIACLPDSDELLDPCYVTGWGRTTISSSDKKFSNILQKAKVSLNIY